MANNPNRRTFLKRSGLFAGMILVPRAGLYAQGESAAESTAANSKLGIAVIGCGGMGRHNPMTAAKERLVALADVDDRKMAEALESIQEMVTVPPVYADYRRMFDEHADEMDVVLIATPDHHHAPAAMRAMERGIHVFVQKPMAQNIAECRAMANAARKYKVHTQMGNQGHCGEGYRRLCELIWSGAIGPVTETHSVLGRSFGGSGGILPEKPVPDYLHWDEWLGPAPWRHYHDDLHPFRWRSWRPFGCGTIGDMACHVLDGVFWALKLGEAKQFTVECIQQVPGSEQMFPKDNVLHWQFGARGYLPPLDVWTYDNVNQKPPIFAEIDRQFGLRQQQQLEQLAQQLQQVQQQLQEPERSPEQEPLDRQALELQQQDLREQYDRQKKAKAEVMSGTIYVGAKGWIFTETYGGGLTIYPEELRSAILEAPKTIPRIKGGPIEDLLNAVRGGPAPCSNFADPAGPFTEFAMTGNLAAVAGAGSKLEWDVENMQCTNLPEINEFVGRTYRKGWEI